MLSSVKQYQAVSSSVSGVSSASSLSSISEESVCVCVKTLTPLCPGLHSQEDPLPTKGHCHPQPDQPAAHGAGHVPGLAEGCGGNEADTPLLQQTEGEAGRGRGMGVA